MTDENPFKKFPKISELAKMLGKTTMTSELLREDGKEARFLLFQSRRFI